MKKQLTTLALIATLGMFAWPSAKAADGDIYDIVPCDANGVDLPTGSTWSTYANPLGSGVDVYFKVRLVARDVTSSPINRWKLTYDGLLPENIAEALYPMRIGIYVSGVKTYADLVSPIAEGSYTTALVFKYTTKPGDFAMPIRLATETGPASDKIGDNTEYSFDPLTADWKMWRLDADSNVQKDCSWVFTSDGTRIGRAYTDISRAPVTDYSLESCGIFVKTVNFSSDAEDPAYWRSIHENSTITGGGVSPRLEISAPSEGARTFYVWSEDKAKIKVKASGSVSVSPVTMKVDPSGATDGDAARNISRSGSGRPEADAWPEAALAPTVAASSSEATDTKVIFFSMRLL